jgi:hypothetical protein
MTEWAQDHYEQTILLPEIAQDGTIRDTRFQRCQVYGPAMLLFGPDTSFSGVTVSEKPDDSDMFKPVFMMTPRPESYAARDVITLQRCRFVNCKFRNVSFTGGEEEMERYFTQIAPGLPHPPPDDD